MNSSLLLSGQILFLVFLFIQSTNGKPLCDSLEEYFRNRKEPGSGRLKKTITRICTAFDVVKYDGVDPLELLLPPNEDEDIVGGGREREPSELEEEFLPEDFVPGQDFDQQQFDSQQFDHQPQAAHHHDQDQDFGQQQDSAPQDSSDQTGNDPVRNRNHPFRHMQHQGINPWAFHPGLPLGFPGPFFLGSNRRQAHKPHNIAAKIHNSAEAWDSSKIAKSNSTSAVVQKTTTTSTTIKPPTTKQEIREPINGTQPDPPSEAEDEYDDLDVEDPLLNDLADFVASIRFLSLNDTSHLSVILPESTATTSHSSAEDVSNTASSRSGGPSHHSTSAEESSGKISLAIEAPDDLLPKSYTRPLPAVDNEAGLPNIHQVRTEFTCDKQLYFPGVYSDVYTDCRVFHLCLPDGYGFRSASFMCPKGLRYSQQRLRCDRAQDVDCSASTSHYANNQYFSRNYVDYLHSLKVLLHGAVGESGETEADYASDQNETDESPDSFGNTINTSMLSKLKNVVTETN